MLTENLGRNSFSTVEMFLEYSAFIYYTSNYVFLSLYTFSSLCCHNTYPKPETW